MCLSKYTFDSFSNILAIVEIREDNTRAVGQRWRSPALRDLCDRIQFRVIQFRMARAGQCLFYYPATRKGLNHVLFELTGKVENLLDRGCPFDFSSLGVRTASPDPLLNCPI